MTNTPKNPIDWIKNNLTEWISPESNSEALENNTKTIVGSVLDSFEISSEEMNDILKKILNLEKVDISDNNLNLLINSWTLEELPPEKVLEIHKELVNSNYRFWQSRMILKKDLKKWRIKTKKLKYLLKLEKDSESLFKIFSRWKIKKHLKKFKSTYGFDYVDSEDINNDIEINSPKIIQETTQDKIKEIQLRINEILEYIHSFVQINWRYVRFLRKNKSQKAKLN